ncbi:MAG: DUF1150 family protein [Candidatus Saccharibacteria bacterium]|nr:DUF1150 family protein [Pseudorhodobacter sp.]
MDVKYNDLPRADSAIVYVRPVAVADLPQDLQDQAAGFETIYAVHRPNGDRLALVADRNMAFALARHHDMAPVPVH